MHQLFVPLIKHNNKTQIYTYTIYWTLHLFTEYMTRSLALSTCLNCWASVTQETGKALLALMCQVCTASHCFQLIATLLKEKFNLAFAQWKSLGECICNNLVPGYKKKVHLSLISQLITAHRKQNVVHSKPNKTWIWVLFAEPENGELLQVCLHPHVISSHYAFKVNFIMSQKYIYVPTTPTSQLCRLA